MLYKSADFNASAKSLINLWGRPCVYKSLVQGVYNPATQTVTNTTTDYNVKAYVAALTYSERQSPNLVDRADQALLIAAVDLDCVPKENDTVVVDGATKTVLAVRTHSTGTGVVVWRLICSKS